MPKSHQQLVDNAQKMLGRINAGISYLGHTQAVTVKKFASALEELSTLLHKLHSDEHESALQEAINLKSLQLEPGATIEEVRARVARALKTVYSSTRDRKEYKELRELLHTNTRNSKASSGHAAESTPTFLSRLWEKHDSLLTGRSEGARLGIAVGEMAVGGILTNVGSQWISQAVTGLKEESLNQSEDNKGHRATTLVMMPMSKQERVLKAVLGGVTASAGIGGSILGISSLFRGH